MAAAEANVALIQGGNINLLPILLVQPAYPHGMSGASISELKIFIVVVQTRLAAPPFFDYHAL